MQTPTASKIIEMRQRAVCAQTPKGMLPYSYGLKILINVGQYMDGSNPALAGGLSWVATWWKHYDG